MALPSINIVRGAGGLGRPTPGFDHYSGLLFIAKNGTLPTGFGTDKEKQFFSLEEAESTGIVEGDANFGVLWYHIQEFFRINEKGVLYVGIYYPQADGGFTNFDAHLWDEIETLQNFADGRIRQMGVFQVDEAFSTTVLNNIQTKAVAVASNFRPLSVIYAGDISATADLTTLADLSALTNKYVSVVIGQDGNAKGKALFDSEGYSITTLGATLGMTSFAGVQQSIAKASSDFNLVTGAELDVPAFANGDLYKDKAPAFLEGINGKSYIFIKKFTDYDGTYHTKAWTCTAQSDDFATIQNNRVIEKAVRLTYINLLPLLNGELKVNKDGTLTEDVVKTYEAFADKGVEQMLRDSEVSAKAVLIDPSQDVLTTSKIVVTLKIVPVGTANEIKVNIGFVPNL